MLNEEQQAALEGVATTLRIILFALATGLFMFTVVVIVIHNEADAGEMLLLTMIGVVVAIAMFLASATVPPLIVSTARKELALERPSRIDGPEYPAPPSDVARLGGIYQTQLIVRSALLEGAGFMNATAYLLESQVISLVIIAVLLVTILAKLPTGKSIIAWVQNELRQLDDLRSIAR
jgi:hypothetical protein